jgi:SAM-dependent methyltransferase
VERPSWVTEDVDLDRPSVARVYDYFLGGSHNFAVDREMAEQLLRLAPDAGEVMRANRAFLRRAVRFMIDEGVTQFLDIGSGIPTVGNVHEIAQKAKPDTKVVYVDIDPVAVAHSRAMLEGQPNTAIVRADLTEPATILGADEVTRLIDLSRPVGLLIVSMLHFLPDEGDPQGATAQLRDALPPGSFLAISHGMWGARPESPEVEKLYQRTPNQVIPRTPAEITAFFGDFDLVKPGLVFLPLWRPDSPEDVGEHPERFVNLAGVARKSGDGRAP